MSTYLTSFGRTDILRSCAVRSAFDSRVRSITSCILHCTAGAGGDVQKSYRMCGAAVTWRTASGTSSQVKLASYKSDTKILWYKDIIPNLGCVHGEGGQGHTTLSGGLHGLARNAGRAAMREEKGRRKSPRCRVRARTPLYGSAQRAACMNMMAQRGMSYSAC